MCKLMCRMATNLALDDQLIREVQEVGGHRTKKEAVTAALKDYLRKHRQQELKGLFGSIEYDRGYSYKRHRTRK